VHDYRKNIYSIDLQLFKIENSRAFGPSRQENLPEQNEVIARAGAECVSKSDANGEYRTSKLKKMSVSLQISIISVRGMVVY
jgi:hypothetical protein